MELAIEESNESGGYRSIACFLVLIYCDLLKINVKKFDGVNYVNNFFSFFSLKGKSKNHIQISILTKNVTKASSIKKVPFLITEEGILIDSTVEIIEKLVTYAKNINKFDDVNCEDKEIKQWLHFADENDFNITSPQALKKLDFHLERKVFLASFLNITLADVVIFSSIYHTFMHMMGSEEKMKKDETMEYKSLINLRRWYDHIQNLPKIRDFAETFLTIINVTEEESSKNMKISENKTRKSEKEGTGNDILQAKKEKSSKVKTVGKEIQKDERPIDDITRLEIRVGLIKKVWKHPEAERLYCEEVDIGENETRKIASGLVNFVKEEELLHQKVLVLTNIKPKVLKGFQSHGMILCATSADNTKVELMIPPCETPVGERVTWEGLHGEPDILLNSKTGKDPFAAVKPYFKTGEDKVGYYKDKKFITTCGPCACKTLVGASIS